jgi:hypothetical protein
VLLLLCIFNGFICSSLVFGSSVHGAGGAGFRLFGPYPAPFPTRKPHLIKTNHAGRGRVF